MRASVRIGASIVAVAASLPGAARAQTRPSLDLRTWRPSIDPRAGLVLEPVTTPGPWQWNTAAFLDYEQAPVTLGGAMRPVAHRLGGDLVAGMGLGERVAVGIDLPFFLWQDSAVSFAPGVLSPDGLPATGLGDLALEGKVTVVSNDRQGFAGGFGLAALGTVTIPTGDRRSFAGEGSATASLSLLGEYALGVGAVRAAIGYRARTAERTWPDPCDLQAQVPCVLGSVTFGDEIPWAFGLTLRPKAVAPAVDAGDRQTWELALHGSLPAGPVAPFGLGGAGASSLSPVLLAADDRVALGHDRDAYLLLGAEAGLDRAFGAPDFRAVVSFGWAPRPHDRDGDGVPDDVDECPDLPEDRDGIQDGDGCPEDDADGDGVPDAQDACPLQAGPPRPDARTNGCPGAK